MTKTEIKNATIQCDQCEQSLLLEGESALIRCASCGNIFDRDFTRSGDTDRMAWRSLWLGLASILLMFFTGFPAIYYGVRSLLRMRYRPTAKRDRTAAVAGVGLGAFFGLVIGPCISLFGLMILIAVMSTDRSTDPVEIAAMLDEFCELDYAEEFEFIRGSQTFQTRSIRWALNTDEEPVKRLVRMELTYFGGFMKDNNSFNVRSITRSEALIDDSFQLNQSTDLMGWTMSQGKEIEARRDELEEVIEGETILSHRYSGICMCDKGLFGLAVCVRQPDAALSEEQVKAIFASCRSKPDPSQIQAESATEN